MKLVNHWNPTIAMWGLCWDWGIQSEERADTAEVAGRYRQCGKALPYLAVRFGGLQGMLGKLEDLTRFGSGWLFFGRLGSMVEGGKYKVNDRKEEIQIFMGKQESGGNGSKCMVFITMSPALYYQPPNFHAEPTTRTEDATFGRCRSSPLDPQTHVCPLKPHIQHPE
ncbi:hypothetical protein PILCRDRAFT_16574 [Piloderma croceum F 1598]|uniref:Uncharacterized protein n=1 Tax=Piloderma croceum (strain F 1598) TaxID=765440 RepID=A0A0C3EVU6_PILCF|nr:hypothetical protein PILCRDRAFT_16574 [Piloderma croceum F 1598]